MSRGKILVVSGQPRALADLIPSLASEGFEVTGAPPTPEVFKQLRKGDWDIVLLSAPPQIPEGTPPASRAPAVVLVRPRSGSTIGIFSGSEPHLLPLEPDPDVLSYLLGEAQSLQEESVEEVLAPLLKMVELLEKDNVSLESILKELAGKIEAEYAAIMIRKGKQLGPICTFSQRGESPTLTRELTALAYPVVEEGKPLILLDGNSPDPEIQSRFSQLGISSGFLLPLRVQVRPLGVIGFLRFKGQFTTHQVDKVKVTCTAVALTLENSQLREEMKLRGIAAEEYKPILEQRRREIAGLNRLLRDQQRKLQEIEELYQSLRLRYVNLLKSMVSLMETGDPLGKGRSALVAEWIVPLAEALGAKTEGLAEAAYLHDVGEVGSLSQELSFEEKEEQLKAHPLLGEKLAQEMGLPKEICQAIRHHHENWDGSGYPEGLAGEKIPLVSRLLRVLDEWAGYILTEGFSEEGALARLKAQAGKELDPQIVEAFSGLLKKAEPPPEVELVSTVSHELRSPLASLVGYSELLASLENLDPVAKKRAEEIHAEALRMNKMVQNLLDISRIELGRLDLELEEIDLAKLINQALEGVRVRAPEHEFLAKLPENLPPVQADPDLILQVLDNLLDNAAKYSPAGSQVTVEVRWGKGEVQVSIHDEGIGIPPDKLKAIFEKFYRVDSPLKGKVPGAGLGLSLCQRIIEAHGGHIWAESKEGQGSTFHFTLPVKKERRSKA